MKVKKEKLLLIAGIVWMIAGFNILNIGFQSYVHYVNLVNVVISILIFLAFWFMVFSKLVIKHKARIYKYKERLQFILNFFDKKSYIIMIVMMSGGITIRMLHLLPEEVIAVFYSGLGCAIFISGIRFTYHFLLYNRSIKRQEVSCKG